MTHVSRDYLTLSFRGISPVTLPALTFLAVPGTCSLSEMEGAVQFLISIPFTLCLRTHLESRGRLRAWLIFYLDLSQK
jgi:hypothetical protein